MVLALSMGYKLAEPHAVNEPPPCDKCVPERGQKLASAVAFDAMLSDRTAAPPKLERKQVGKLR